MGGIYSVIKSKATVTTLEYGNRYTLIGPYNRRSVCSAGPLPFTFEPVHLTTLQANVEVEELEPTSNEMKATIDSMSERGIHLVYGRWLVEGAPRVLLIDTSTGYRWLNEWKSDLWSVAGIPSPPDDHETNEAIVFGYLVAWFLGEVWTHLLTHGRPLSSFRLQSPVSIAVNREFAG